MNLRHFITVSVAVALGGCQICTDCEPVDYVLDEPDIVYGDSFYLDEGSDVFTEDVIIGDEVWTEGETWTEGVTQEYIPSSTYQYYSMPPQTYTPWRNSGRQLPYSGPSFSTPPMQPMPYPTETYYPFKRPSPGIFTPWRNTMRPAYYPKYSVPTYRPMPYFY